MEETIVHLKFDRKLSAEEIDALLTTLGEFKWAAKTGMSIISMPDISSLKANPVPDVMPTAWQSGDWHGRRSDEVLVGTAEGRHNICRLYEGILDGSEFSEWYTHDDVQVHNVIWWMKLPEK